MKKDILVIRNGKVVAMNFAPPTKTQTNQQNVTTAKGRNSLANALKSGKFELQGSSVIPNELSALLAENPDVEVFVKATLTTDEPKKGRNNRAVLPAFMPADNADYSFSTEVPQEIQTKFKSFAGKKVNFPANEQLAEDAERNDYKTGSTLWFRLNAIEGDGGRVIPFFRYESAA